MRKNIIMITKFILALLLSAPSLYAQQDAKATEILQKTEAKYDRYKTMKVEFEQRIQNPESDLDQTSEGTLYLAGNKYKLITEGQVIISDSKKMYLYFEEENELMVDYADQDENSFTPSDLFSLYKKDFKYAYAGTPVINGKKMHVILFSPKDPEQYDFHIIKLYINANDYSIEQAEISDNMANKVTYIIKKIEPNIPLNDDFFRFDPSKYPDIIITDNTE